MKRSDRKKIQDAIELLQEVLRKDREENPTTQDDGGAGSGGGEPGGGGGPGTPP